MPYSFQKCIVFLIPKKFLRNWKFEHKRPDYRLGKASGVFGRLTKIWRDNGLSTHTKIRLYEVLVLSTILYGAETWPVSVSNTKKLEAAHHRWQKKILKNSWKDMVTKKGVREKTGQDTL